MSVSGNWVNGYGSVMFLNQASNGMVTGVYTSTTGSSGSYWVAGWANPNAPGDIGEALAYSILWRSFAGGTPDPSWHWVSGMSGQMLSLDPLTNAATLIMIHDMVATVAFPALDAPPGSYLDKLAYVPYSGGESSPGQWPPTFTPPSQPDPVDGPWQCVQDPSVSLSLTVQDEQSGFVTGTLTTAAGVCDVAGFTDTGAGGAGLALQGLTLSALLPNGQTVAALAGSLDLAAGTLSLDWLQSNGTAANATYLQTTIKGMTFTRP